MDENGIEPQGQNPGLTPDGSGGATPLKRKATIIVAVALVVAGLGVGDAWVTGAFAPRSEAATGNGTLTEHANKDMVNKVTDNASKAPAADKEKVEEKKDAAVDGAAKAEGNESDAAKPSTSSGSASSKSDSKLSSSSTSKPSHEHTWQAQYRTEPVYTTEYYTIVDQGEWDEQVRSGSHFLFSDGRICYGSMEAMNYQFDTGCSYSVVDDYKTVHHEAVTHQGTRQVQTGTKQVLTGYRCSGCGATK